MNKKFLSAILFGALMVTSTGTFVSCKDYDDDIDNLQTQIDKNSTAIAELKALLGDGNYVTNVTVSGQNLVVTSKNGTSTVALPECEGGVQAEVKNGELYIDGAATGIKVAAGEAVKVVDGEWAILQADGSYKSTNIPASGVTVAGDEKEGYVLTIVDAEGVETKIELPTAASSISSLSLNNGNEVIYTLDYFNFAPEEDSKKSWKTATGKEVGAASEIYFSEEGAGLRVNPVTVDAKEIDFTLVNGKNEEFPLVVLNATEDKAYTSTTRAAYGNGLYTLNVKTFSVIADATKEPAKTFKAYLAADKGYYAVAANSAIRAEYNVKVEAGEEQTADLGEIKVADVEAASAVTVAGAATVKAGVEQEVTVENETDLYDLYLNATAEDINIFGIVFSADRKSFTITKSPDQVTAANFPLTVYTMDNSGVYAETVITITLSEAIDATAEYATRTLAIVANKEDQSDANFFKADMATMTKALGANLDIWKRKVAYGEVSIYEDAACTTYMGAAEEYGIEFSYLGADGKATTSITAAADMKFYVVNETASAKFDVNTVYYAKVSFKNATEEELNSIVVPFQFTVPALATYFEVETAVFKGDVAYAYMNIEDQTEGEAAYKLSRAFKKYPEGVAIALNNETKIVGDKTSAALATLAETFTADAMITLEDVFAEGNVDGTQVGYAQELVITATEAEYEGWERAEADQTYTFKVKMMSPIFEGTVTSIKSSVEMTVTDGGYKMGNKDIEGKTYGAVPYKVFQDKANAWSRAEIASVTGKSENVNVAVLEGANESGVATAVAATADAEGNITEGYLKVIPQQIENTTDVIVNLTVTDIWGYKKVSPITVTVKK